MQAHEHPTQRQWAQVWEGKGMRANGQGQPLSAGIGQRTGALGNSTPRGRRGRKVKP